MGRTLRNLAVHSPRALADAVLDEFPWASLLPKTDQKVFIDEFTRTVLAAAELDNFAPLGQLVDEWRATAEIHADPELARRLRRPVTAVGNAVKRPPRRGS